MAENENPLKEIMRIWGQSEEALLKRKITYQEVNGHPFARIGEEINEGEDGEIEITKEEDRLLDDNGYPIGKTGAAQAECGCWLSLRFLRVCPGCRKPICRTHSGCIPEIGSLCPACYRLIRGEMRKRALKDFFFRRKEK